MLNVIFESLLFSTVLCFCIWQVNNAVMNMVDLYFPPSTGVSVIAEPGSFFVSSAFSLAVNIISKEVVARDYQDQEDGEWHQIYIIKMLELNYILKCECV